MEQHKLAACVGCSKETIRKIEKGNIKLSEQLAYRIALETGVSRAWLLANDLTAPPVNKFGRPYTRHDFEDAQAASNAEISPALATQVHLIYSARMKAIAAKAWKDGWKQYQLVAYKINAALAELEEQSGYDETVYSVGNPDLRRAVELAKRDVEEMDAEAASLASIASLSLEERIARLREMKAEIDEEALKRMMKKPKRAN